MHRIFCCVLTAFLIGSLTDTNAQVRDSLKRVRFIRAVELFTGGGQSLNRGNMFVGNFRGTFAGNNYVVTERLFKPAFVVGVGAYHPLAKRVDLNVRIQYEIKGTKNRVDNPLNPVNNDARVITTDNNRYDYWTLTAAPVFYPDRRRKWAFSLGGYYSRIRYLNGAMDWYNTMDETTYSGSHEGRYYYHLHEDGGRDGFSWNPGLNGINKNDFGIVASVSCAVAVKHHSFVIQLQDNLGLTDINRNNPYGYKERNHAVVLMVGFRLNRNVSSKPSRQKMSNLNSSKMQTNLKELPMSSGYSLVNGLQLYYEVYGSGKPLVLIHGGGSTIQSSFEKLIPLLAKDRQVIAVELQAHGRTGDRDADTSFEQDADDVAALLTNLKIPKASFLGFSNGATTALQLAIRHPEIVDRIVLCAPLAKRNGVPEQFWDFMKNASLDNMPQQLKDSYLKVNPDPRGLQIMHDRDAKRMVNFEDIPDAQLAGIQAPTLIINGDRDIITREHVMELNRLIVNSRLETVPGVHGEYIGEVTTVKPDSKETDLTAIGIIDEFLAGTK